MEEVIWVEVLSRHRDVATRHRCTGAEIRIGRGYDNDVVIDDAHVARAHVRIARDEDGALFAEDLGSANGMFTDRGRKRLRRIRLDGESVFRIGNTMLRVREAGHPVAPERPFKRNLHRWTLAGVLGATALAIEIAWLWLSETGEPKLTHYVSPLFISSLLVLAWTAGWSILSRIFAGEARFERHLVIALAGLLAYSLYDEIAAFAAYSLSSYTIASHQGVASWILLAGASFFHLRAIGPSRLKLKAAAVAALAAAVIILQALNQSEIQETFGQEAALRRLMPPMLRLAPVKDTAAFAQDVEALRRTLDRDRREPPSQPVLGSLFAVDQD